MATRTQTENVLLLGGIAVGVYLLWPYLKNLGQGLSAAGAAECRAVTGIAQWYANFTGCGATVPTGSFLFPNGNAVPVASFPGLTSNQISYGGQNYSIVGQSDQNGNWAVVPSC